MDLKKPESCPSSIASKSVETKILVYSLCVWKSLVELASSIQIQWNPREVNTLEVNSRLKSTPHGGPDFFFFV